jgi:hypothetical protein
MAWPATAALRLILSVLLAAGAEATTRPPLPVGPFAPAIIPAVPKPNWSWDRIPTSYHGKQ